MDLSTFELLAAIGTGVVVVGVTLEGAEILIKVIERRRARIWIKREGSRKWLFSFIWFVRLIRPVMLWIEGIALGIVIAGLAIEWLGTNGADRIKTAENAALNIEASAAWTNAASAIALSRQLETTNLTLQMQVELLRSNNDVLEEEQLPMKIGNMDSFAQSLKPIPNINVVITNTPLDEKSLTTAFNLSSDLKYDGWNILDNFKEPRRQ